METIECMDQVTKIVRADRQERDAFVREMLAEVYCCSCNTLIDFENDPHVPLWLIKAPHDGTPFFCDACNTVCPGCVDDLKAGNLFRHVQERVENAQVSASCFDRVLRLIETVECDGTLWGCDGPEWQR